MKCVSDIEDCEYYERIHEIEITNLTRLDRRSSFVDFTKRELSMLEKYVEIMHLENYFMVANPHEKIKHTIEFYKKTCDQFDGLIKFIEFLIENDKVDYWCHF